MEEARVDYDHFGAVVAIGDGVAGLRLRFGQGEHGRHPAHHARCVFVVGVATVAAASTAGRPAAPPAAARALLLVDKVEVAAILDHAPFDRAVVAPQKDLRLARIRPQHQVVGTQHDNDRKHGGDALWQARLAPGRVKKQSGGKEKQYGGKKRSRRQLGHGVLADMD